MDNRELDMWDKQTAILMANGYTSDEINQKDIYNRHYMIRNNCEGFEIGDFYNNNEFNY